VKFVKFVTGFFRCEWVIDDGHEHVHVHEHVNEHDHDHDHEHVNVHEHEPPYEPKLKGMLSCFREKIAVSRTTGSESLRFAMISLDRLRKRC